MASFQEWYESKNKKDGKNEGGLSFQEWVTKRGGIQTSTNAAPQPPASSTPAPEFEGRNRPDPNEWTREEAAATGTKKTIFQTALDKIDQAKTLAAKDKTPSTHLSGRIDEDKPAITKEDVLQASDNYDKARANSFGASMALGAALTVRGQNPLSDSMPDVQAWANSAIAKAQAAKAAEQDALAQFNTIAERYQEQERERKYDAMRKNPEFAAKSKGDEETAREAAGKMGTSGIMAAYYQIYHRNDPVKTTEDLMTGLGASLLGGELNRAQQPNYTAGNDLSFIRDDEADTFFYLWNTQGPKAASTYLDSIRGDLNARRNTEQEKLTIQYAQEHPVKASAESVLQNQFSIAGMVDLTVQNLRRQFGDKTKPIDYNTPAQDFGKTTQRIRDTVAKDLEDKYPDATLFGITNLASFAYQTGMSMADSTAQLIMNQLGVPEAVTLSLLSGGAAQQAVYDAKARGASDGNALLSGYAAGLAEAVFEKASLDTMVENTLKTTGKSIGQRVVGDVLDGNWFQRFVKKLAAGIIDVGIQGGVEASEEGFTTIANTVSDIAINQDKSQIMSDIQHLIDNGVDAGQAAKSVMKDWANGLLMDAIGGLVSGIGMGGTGAVARGVVNSAVGQPAQTDNRLTLPRTTPQVAPVQADTSTQIQAFPTNATLDALVNKLQSGEQLSGQDARKILSDPEAMQTLVDAGYLDGDVHNDSDGRKAIVAAVEKYATETNIPEAENATEANMPPVPTETNIPAPESATETPPVPHNPVRETREPQGLTLPRTPEKPAQTTLTLPSTQNAAQAEGDLVARLRGSKPGLLVDDWVRSTYDEDTIRTLDESAKRLGHRVGFADPNTISGGEDNAKIYDDGVLLIEKGNPNPLGYLYGHEVGHWLKWNSPDAYNEFAEAARATDPKWFAAKEEQYRNAKPEMSLEAIQEEVLSDYAGWLVQNQDVLDRFINQNKEKPNVLRRLYEAIKALAAKLTGKEKQQAESAADLLLKAMNATEANVQNGIMSTGETKSSFAGLNARYADAGAKAEAERLTKKRNGPAYSNWVRGKTGWFKGGDGKWRFEIDDSNSRVVIDDTLKHLYDEPDYEDLAALLYRQGRDDFLFDDESERLDKLIERYVYEEGLPSPSDVAVKIASGNGTVGDVLDHEELFRQYPSIASTPLGFKNLGKDTNGQVNWGVITLNKDLLENEKQLRSTLLHEIQHIIQSEEGFARGSSPEYWQRQIDRDEESFLRPSEVSALNAYNRFKDEHPDLVNDAQKVDRMFDENHERYKHISGDDWMSNETGEAFTTDEVWGQYNDLREEMYNKYGDLVDEYYNVLGLLGGPDEAEAAASRGAQPRSAFELYQDTYGEGEARNVQARANLTAEQRSKIAPFRGDEDSVFVEKHSTKGLGADTVPESMQIDKDYTAALEDGKIADAARMVQEAADAAMPYSKVRNASTGELRYVYHYTNKNFYEFKPMGQSAGSNRTLGDGYYVSTSETEFKSFGKNKMTLFANITNPFEMELTEQQAQAVYDKYFRPHHEDRFHTYEPHVVGKLQSYSQVFDYLKEAAEKNGTTTSAILSELGFDGVHSGPEWVAFKPEQLKSADVVTYDDNGQMIPLSERFNPESKDTRHSLKGFDYDIAPASVQKSGQMPARKNDRVERMKFKYEQAIDEQKGKTFQANAQRNSDLARQKREFQERMAAQRERENERRERTTFKHEQEVEEVKGKLFQERARRYSELAKQKREFQEKEAKGKEERRARELREKIATHTKRLLTEYKRPTDKHHVPEGLRGAVNAVLSTINMSSGYSLAEDGDGGQLHVPIGEGVAETKRTQAFAQLRSELENERERLVLDWSMIDDPDGALNKLVGEWADTPIANMDSEQLQAVYDILRNVEHAIKTADRMLSQARWGNVSNFANALREENVGKNQPLQLNGKLGNVLKHVRLDILTPEAYFHRLGDSGKAVFKMLRNGQDNYIRSITNAVNATNDILKGADVRKLETDKHTVTLGGTEVTMSTAQLMELYCLMQRDQGMQHISTGGVVVEPGKGIKKNTQLDPIHPTEQELNDAIDQLTPEQIRMAEAMQVYLTKDMSDLGNEATMQVYGYKKFGNEDNYWKIRSNKNELQSTVEKDTQTTSVANKGFTKATKPNANTSVLIGSAFDTFSQSVSDMAAYSAWLAISEDLNRIRNYTFRDENGNRITTIQTILDRGHGEGGASYFKQLMADIANGTQNDAGLTEGFVGAYKAAAIGANIRVIVQQPTAILRALEMIDSKYFANIKDPFKAFERAKKYAPIAQWKDWGYFDINTGRKMKDVLMESAETPLEKARQVLMSPAGKADSWAWGILWNAVEKETAKTTNLTPGSSEFYQHCAERFSDIIDHTQVVDGIIQRSPIQRSKNSINKMASSFMSEPLKQYAQFMSAVYDVKNGKSGAGKHLVRTTVAMAAAGLLNTAVQSLVDALRDDDKEKKYWEKFLEKFLGYNSDDDTIRKKIKTFLGSNMGELVNPAEYIPYAKDIMSIYKGYDVERMDMSLVADLVTAVNRLQNTLAGDTKYTVANAVASVTEQLAKLTGIPAANIDRDIKSVINTVANEADMPLLQYYMNRYRFKPSKSGNLSDDLTNILWSAKQKGNEDYQAVYDRLIKDGYSEEKINDAMMTKMSETTGLTQAIKDADAANNANQSYDTLEILSAFESLDLPQDDAETLLEWKLSDEQREKYTTLKDADIKYDTRFDIMRKYSELNADKELDSGDKALEFSRYVDSLDLTDEQNELVKDTYKFWSRVPAQATRYENLKDAGLDEDKSKHTTELLGSLQPLPGKEDVTDMQRYRAIESDKELTSAEKIKVIGSIMGPELKTEQGNPTQWAKFQQAVNDGVGIGKALDMVERDSLDIYVKMKSTGMPSNSAVTAAEGIKELKPLPGKESVTDVQRYRKIASMSSLSAGDKLKAIGAYMGTEMVTEKGNPSQWAKFNLALSNGRSLSQAIDLVENGRLDEFMKWTESAAKGKNVKWDVYDTFLKETAKLDGKENGVSVNGLLKKRVVAYIDSLNLTPEQKDALLTDYNSTYKHDVTWHNGSYGSASGAGKTYAPAKLRLPTTAERTYQTSSRLQLPRTPQARPTQQNKLRLK